MSGSATYSKGKCLFWKCDPSLSSWEVVSTQNSVTTGGLHVQVLQGLLEGRAWGLPLPSPQQEGGGPAASCLTAPQELRNMDPARRGAIEEGGTVGSSSR